MLAWLGTAMLIIAVSATSADDMDRQYIVDSLFWCQWAAETAPAGNPVKVGLCEGDAPTEIYPDLITHTGEEIDAWWQYWDMNDSEVAKKLWDSWDAASLAHRAETQRKASAARLAAQKVARAKRLAAIPTMSIAQLCAIVRSRDPNPAHEELVKRRAFAPADLQLIAARQFALGMPEDALFCTMGAPDRSSRSVGAWGVDVQYVYGSTFIYTRNGKITSWQD